MGTEDEIAALLLQGATPRDLAKRYNKSTVYKVADNLRARQAPAPVPQILVTPNPDWGRFLPGSTASLGFIASNRATDDFYVFQAGVRPEWLPSDQWLSGTQKKLLAGGGSMALRFTVPVPDTTPLGMYDVSFGVQGQWVGPRASGSPDGIMWTTPFALRVQNPPSGDAVFLAHSVPSMAPISQLEATLDNYGIATIASEESTAADIARCSFFIAVIATPHRVSTVLEEIAIARQQGKEPILLRDHFMGTMMPVMAELNWIDVPGLTSGIDAAIPFVFQELQKLGQKRALKKAAQQEQNLERVLLALGAFAVGIAIAKGGGGA